MTGPGNFTLKAINGNGVIVANDTATSQAHALLLTAKPDDPRTAL
jgi:hypothetical protein